MKKIFNYGLALLLVFLAASCQKNDNPKNEETKSPTVVESKEESKTPTPEVPSIYTEYEASYVDGTLNSNGLANNIQDGVILHAFNWSYNTIKSQMATIKECGYTAVQTSPVQQVKSSSTVGSWDACWSNLYQPVAFSVSASGYLGTKEELVEMCSEANKYGVKVICDIVVNHMANDNTGKGYSERIEEFEPTVWSNKETYFHQYSNQAGDSSALTVTQYQLSGLPDLNTKNEYIQSRVISLLKELIDCGVSGFRFDAAKHIETPDDGEYASNFWPNILEASTTYAKNTYNKDMYYYGEILNNCGGGRKFTSYTKYMSVTDTNYSNSVRSAVTTLSEYSLKSCLKYKVSEDGKKSVVWAESHDTYADKTTSNIATSKINLIYSIEACHTGAASLYLARPKTSTAMGAIGDSSWESAEISAVNNFRNKFLTCKETTSVQSNVLVMEKTSDTQNGCVLFNNNGYKKNITVTFKNFSDGTYYDQATGKEYKVENKTLTTSLEKDQVLVLTNEVPKLKPTIIVSSETGYFYESYELTVSAKNATKITYSINGGEFTVIENNQKITLNETSTVTITCYNGDLVKTQQYSYSKIEKKEGYTACAGLSNPEAKVFAWVWKSGGNGHWQEVLVVGNTCYVEKTEECNMYLIASFAADTTLANLEAWGNEAWSHKIGQTGDMELDTEKITISTI